MTVDTFGLELESDAFDTSDLQVFALEGREAISELFRFDIDVAAGASAATDALVPGEPLTLVFRRDGEVVRRVHGMLGGVRQRLDQGNGRQSWRLRLVPRAARLELVATQSIFLDKTVPEIVAHKLDAVGLDEASSLELVGAYPAQELVVQIGETDLAMVQRRCEQIGISYFFDHGDSEEHICFVDTNAAFPELPGGNMELATAENEIDRVGSFERQDVMVPALYAIEDYNYRNPAVAVTGEAAIEGGAGGIIEYGAHASSPDEATTLAQVRADEIACRRSVYHGESTVARLTAGYRVTVEEHGDLPAVELLLTAVEHLASLPLTAESEEQAGYQNSFEAVSTATTFRPRRTTPKPTMPGVVTGVVQGGTNGGPAVLDSDGRYTVQLHFETPLGEDRARASHPIRMAQPFGGTGHGMHFPLRPGTEVVLGFANGDPDRPLILAAIPNAHTLSPVTGADPTRNRITTRMGVAFEIGERE